MTGLACVYAPPGGAPSEWEREPPAAVVIGNGGRVSWGDFSIVFDGTDKGQAFHVRPWKVEWLGAVGGTGVSEAHFTMRRFRRYRDAVRYAKNRERERLRSLRGKR